jgi:Matrixin
VNVDASSVSRLLTIPEIAGLAPAQNGKISVVVLPADGFRLQLDQGVTDLGFSVGITGTVILNPEMTDWLGIVPGPARGSPTVRVLHHPALQQADPPPTSRFCGVADTPPQMLGRRPLSYGSPLGRWTRGNLTINVDATRCKGLTPDLVRAVTFDAYSRYEAPSNRFFSFGQGGPDSDIRLQFGGTELDPRLGIPGGAIGVGQKPPEGGVFLDAGTTWTAQLLESVVLHEAGHTLGLSHSTLPSSTMYPVAPNTVSLDPETIEAIQSLYGWLPQVPLADRASTDGPSFAVVSEFAFGGPETDTIFMAWKGSEAIQVYISL